MICNIPLRQWTDGCTELILHPSSNAAPPVLNVIMKAVVHTSIITTRFADLPEMPGIYENPYHIILTAILTMAVGERGLKRN